MEFGARLQVGFSLPTWPLRDGSHMRWPELRALALDLEALGVDTLWVADHLLRSGAGGRRIGFWECWTIATAVAGATSKVEIGPFVACTGFRNPGLLAKMAATLDEVSDGRLVLGLGGGVPATDRSWAAFGFDPTHHVTRYAESVEAVTRLLRERAVTFQGRLVQVDDAEIIPRGPRPEGPPIWVAAAGSRTAGIAARWGDAINVNRPLATLEDLLAVKAVADRACEAVGRDPATLALTGWARLAIDDQGSAVARDGWLAGRPEEVAAMLAAFHERGLRHVSLYAGTTDDRSPLPALTRSTLDRAVPFLEAVGVHG